MSHANVLLLLGSNLGDREKNLKAARELISAEIGEIISEGQIMETEPVEFTSDEMFLNQILQVKTALSPVKLLKQIKKAEKELGRIYTPPKRGEKYVSRIIDIDILTYDSLNYSSKFLAIPHPQIYNRDFVKRLLADF